jgi:carboxynorspermidine decarboxylase
MRPWTEARERLERFRRLDLKRLPSPCFVVDEVAIEENCRLLAEVQRASGAKVLAALKAFSMWSLGPLVARYLSGSCASGLHEARLGREAYGGEVHTFCAAFTERELREVLEISDHVVFNSHAQWSRFGALARAAQAERPRLRFGLRVNPEQSEGAVPLYDPCAPCSRLGIPRAEFRPDQLEGISGLHFHTLCEQDFPPLERTVAAFEQKFGEFIPRMEWINFGGGHHITRFDYQVEALIALLQDFRARHGVALYLEPLRVGQRLVFEDMAYYTMVKTTTFNGINLPSIAIWNSRTDALRIVRSFGYEDFKGRLS